MTNAIVTVAAFTSAIAALVMAALIAGPVAALVASMRGLLG